MYNIFKFTNMGNFYNFANTVINQFSLQILMLKCFMCMAHVHDIIYIEVQLFQHLRNQR